MIAVVFVVFLTGYFHVKYTEKTLAYAPTILTTTGIFATFLGIALGLLNFDTNNIQASVPALLNGLKTAFWASVFGVGGALTIKFRHYFLGIEHEVEGSGSDGEVTAQDIVISLRNIQQALVGGEEATLVSQLKLLRQDNNDRLDSLKQAQQEALQKLTEMSSKTLVEALRDVIRDFNTKITEQFGDNFKQLNEAVGKLLIWQEQYKTHIEVVVEQHNNIANTMQTASDNYSLLVNKTETFTKVSSDLSMLLTSLEMQKNTLIEMLKSLGQLLTTASGSLPEIENKVVDLTQQLTRSVEFNQKEVNKALLENAQLIKSSSQDVERDIKKTHQEFSRSVEEISNKTSKHTTELTQCISRAIESSQKEVNKALSDNTLLIRTSVQEVGRDFQKINQDFNKHMGDLADKTNKQVAVLDAALAEELKKSLESLGRQLAALSEKFVSDYTPLAEKLRQVVSLSRQI